MPTGGKKIIARKQSKSEPGGGEKSEAGEKKLKGY